MIEVRCESTSPGSCYNDNEYKGGSHSYKVPVIISDIESDDGLCDDEVHVWALGSEVAEALQQAVFCAESGITSVTEDHHKDASSLVDGKAKRIVLPRLSRLSFVGAYFNIAAKDVPLNMKKSWRTGTAFENLLHFVEHRARNSDGAPEGAGRSRTLSISDLHSRLRSDAVVFDCCATRVVPPSTGGSMPSLHFSGCFGIRDEWYDKLSSRCGATSLSPHALRTSRLHSGALEWDICDPWFVPNTAPMDDEESKSEIPEKVRFEGEEMNNVGDVLSEDSEPRTLFQVEALQRKRGRC